MDLARSSVVVHVDEGDPERFSTDYVRDRIFPSKRWDIREVEESPSVFRVEFENGIGLRVDEEQVVVSMSYEEGEISFPVRDLHDGLTRYGQRLIEASAGSGLLGLDLCFAARSDQNDLSGVTSGLPEGARPTVLTYRFSVDDLRARVVHRLYGSREVDRMLWIEATFPARLTDSSAGDRADALTDHLGRRLECLRRVGEWLRASGFIS